MTVPAGWEGLDNFCVVKGDGLEFMAVVLWPAGDFITADIYTDPCNWWTSIAEPPVGLTVDDLANALAAQAMRGDAVSTDVTVDGFDGKYLEMSVPADIDFADCDQ